MAFRVEITPQALEDLDSIASYIKSGSSFAVAEKWFNGIMKEVASLADMPGRCFRAPESEILGKEIRMLPHGRRNRRYKIYFAIDEAAQAVRVFHIRHWAMHPIVADELEDLLN